MKRARLLINALMSFSYHSDEAYMLRGIIEMPSPMGAAAREAVPGELEVKWRIEGVVLCILTSGLRLMGDK